MSFSVEGDYFEVCTCAVTCPCSFLGPATHDTCDVLVGWHVDRGSMDGVSLDGLNVALAVRAPKQMTNGGWTAALYLDDRADQAQADALGAIFSGQAGGHLANVAPLIGEVAVVRPASITFERNGTKRSLTVDDVATADVVETVGGDGVNPTILTNVQLSPVTQPVRQARAEGARYDDAFQFETSGSNGFVAEFAYQS